jgi:hypothetical protein
MSSTRIRITKDGKIRITKDGRVRIVTRIKTQWIKDTPPTDIWIKEQ